MWYCQEKKQNKRRNNYWNNKVLLFIKVMLLMDLAMKSSNQLLILLTQENILKIRVSIQNNLIIFPDIIYESINNSWGNTMRTNGFMLNKSRMALLWMVMQSHWSRPIWSRNRIIFQVSEVYDDHICYCFNPKYSSLCFLFRRLCYPAIKKSIIFLKYW